MSCASQEVVGLKQNGATFVARFLNFSKPQEIVGLFEKDVPQSIHLMDIMWEVILDSNSKIPVIFAPTQGMMQTLSARPNISPGQPSFAERSDLSWALE